MTADQTLARIDDALRRNEQRFDLTAGGIVEATGQATAMRWRPRPHTASGPGWVHPRSPELESTAPSLPVTFQEIADRDLAERAAVAPVRSLLEAQFPMRCAGCLEVIPSSAVGCSRPSCRPAWSGERSHAASLAVGGSSLAEPTRTTPVTRGEAAQPKGFWAVLRRLINIGRKYR